jgi:hypothetical protein
VRILLLGAALVAIFVGTAADAAADIHRYRAVASLRVTERFPDIFGPSDCFSRGSRIVRWKASIPRLVAITRPATLVTTRRGRGTFKRLQSRVDSNCPGAFANQFAGTPFRLSATLRGNRLRVDTATAQLDEGEGGGWTHLGCRQGTLNTKRVALGGGDPFYTEATAKLKAAERRAILAGREVRVRRAITRSFSASRDCGGFGGDNFVVRTALDVHLIPR